MRHCGWAYSCDRGLVFSNRPLLAAGGLDPLPSRFNVGTWAGTSVCPSFVGDSPNPLGRLGQFRKLAQSWISSWSATFPALPLLTGHATAPPPLPHSVERPSPQRPPAPGAAAHGPSPGRRAPIVVNTTDLWDDRVADGRHTGMIEAIRLANAMPGLDKIHFDIPGPGPHTIPR